MASKKKNDPTWGFTPAGGRFSARLHEIAAKKGITDVGGIVRLSPEYKAGRVTHWWNGTRLPDPMSIVLLARRLGVDPLEFIGPMRLDMNRQATVEAIVKSESAA